VESRKASDISAFFEPRTVAVFGSLKETTGAGWGAIRNMLDFGFKGKIYPVNPSGGEIFGLQVYTTVEQVPEPLDLAMVIIPPQAVPATVQQCGRKGIRAVIIGTEGFAEADEGGATLQRHILDLAHRYGLRILGPNTIGVVNTANGLVTTPYPTGYKSFLKGGIAYCGQSGLVSAHSHPMEPYAYPLSKICDFGNKCDVNEVDLIDYLSQDQDTKVIAMHLEDIKDGRKFLEIARKTVVKKPVLIFKTGQTEAGAKAAASHTGSLSGDDRIYEAAFRQAGILRLGNWTGFWEIPRIFASQPLPGGPRVAIISLSGGAGVVAADLAVKNGLVVTSFSDKTKQKLLAFSPRLANNPVDIGPAATVANDPISLSEAIMSVVLADKMADSAVILMHSGLGRAITPLIDMLRRVHRNTTKPLVVWMDGPVPSVTAQLFCELARDGLPTYLDLEAAIKALSLAVAYSRIKSEFSECAA
jgi:acyl-CoA synthetase (NDP forming)